MDNITVKYGKLKKIIEALEIQKLDSNIIYDGEKDG